MSKLEKTMMNNPMLVLFLATTITVGSTSSVKGALAMAVAVILVLLLSSLILSLLNKFIDDDIRFITSLIVVSGTASLVQMLLAAFLPSGYKMISLYVAILAVDLSIYYNNKTLKDENISQSLKKSLSLGLYYAVVILVIASIRELFGNGSFYGKTIDILADNKIAILSNAFGGYMLLAFVMAFCNKNNEGKENLEGIFAQKCCCDKEGE